MTERVRVKTHLLASSPGLVVWGGITALVWLLGFTGTVFGLGNLTADFQHNVSPSVTVTFLLFVSAIVAFLANASMLILAVLTLVRAVRTKQATGAIA